MKSRRKTCGFSVRMAGEHAFSETSFRKNFQSDDLVCPAGNAKLFIGGDDTHAHSRIIRRNNSLATACVVFVCVQLYPQRGKLFADHSADARGVLADACREHKVAIPPGESLMRTVGTIFYTDFSITMACFAVSLTGSCCCACFCIIRLADGYVGRHADRNAACGFSGPCDWSQAGACTEIAIS